MAIPEGRDPAIPVVSGQRVREAGGRITVPIQGHKGCDQPVVEVIRQGEVVHAIDITCPCGRRLRVLCDYRGVQSTE